MRLGIVGSGMIVKEFLKITPQFKDLELTAILGTKKSEEKLKELKNKYNIKNIFYDYDEFLSCDLDAVYIALPNNLHFEFAEKALEANKNVILEKPFTTNYNEALILSNLAKQKQLLLLEAVTTLYFPNYKKIKELLPLLGNIKIVQLNYSQYSSRYDKFKEGIVLPVFDPKLSGGALMDLNIYNIHFAAGLFGKPENVEYYPNMERGIDTSGILILDYGNFKCVCIGAKDCKAPLSNNIQGDKGCIHLDNSVSLCTSFELLMNDGTEESFNENNYEHRMVNEFIEFVDIIEKKDLKRCYEVLDHSLLVSEIETTARNKGGVVFP